MRGWTVAVAGAALVLGASSAHADDLDLRPAGQAAFGLGGSTRDPHFRLGPDAAAGIALDGDDEMWTFTGVVVTGFGKWWCRRGF
jgi:hypothetical protein